MTILTIVTRYYLFKIFKFLQHWRYTISVGYRYIPRPSSSVQVSRSEDLHCSSCLYYQPAPAASIIITTVGIFQYYGRLIQLINKHTITTVSDVSFKRVNMFLTMKNISNIAVRRTWDQNWETITDSEEKSQAQYTNTYSGKKSIYCERYL